jgi:DNA repair protein RadC
VRCDVTPPASGNPARVELENVMTHSISATTFFVRESETYRQATDAELVAAARRTLAKRCKAGRCLRSPGATRDYLNITMAELEHEVFVLILLNTRHHILAIEELSRGTIDGASVHPREVVKSALRANAAAVICAHNHPSGIAEPSSADELITRRLSDALALIDVRLLDHLIVSGDCVYSFAEHGLL